VYFVHAQDVKNSLSYSQVQKTQLNSTTKPNEQIQNQHQAIASAMTEPKKNKTFPFSTQCLPAGPLLDSEFRRKQPPRKNKTLPQQNKQTTESPRASQGTP
jgi:hypothetical protein